MREASLTPIPADMDAQVRSLPDWIDSTSKKSKERTMPEVTPVAPVVDEAAVRTAAHAEGKRIAEVAESLGLRAADYIGKSLADAQSEMLRAVVDKKKTELPEPKQTATPSIDVLYDQVDKSRDAVAETMMARVFTPDKPVLNGMSAHSYLDIAKNHARSVGVRGVDKWDRKDAAFYFLGRTEQINGYRDAANISNGSFATFVTLNAITKIVARGFEMIPNYVKYQEISEGQIVPDFKQYSIGGLGTANYVQTAENLPFPELVKSEGVFNSTAKMWGGTLSLTLQALINDDTMAFDRSLRGAGAGAQKTIDQRCFLRFLQGTAASSGTSTWTSNTTSGASIVTTTADSAAGARGRIGIARAALMNKTGLDGNPLGTIPNVLLCGPTNEQNALGLCLPAGGQIVATAPSIASLRVVVSPWLEASALTGSSTTTYYLGATPDQGTTGLIVSRIAGFENPTVMEYDAGALAARKWKCFLPFEVDLVNVSVSGTSTILAWQQATT